MRRTRAISTQSNKPTCKFCLSIDPSFIGQHLGRRKGVIESKKRYFFKIKTKQAISKHPCPTLVLYLREKYIRDSGVETEMERSMEDWEYNKLKSLIEKE